MSGSILDTTKSSLGIPVELDVFDDALVGFINSSLMSLHQIGVGTPEGFVISDRAETWEQLSANQLIQKASRTYVYYKVRLAFDPPQTGPGIGAVEKQLDQLEWRLQVLAETE